MDPVLNGALNIITIIKNALDTDEGALIGRNGTIELEQMISGNTESLYVLEKNAGIFPSMNPFVFLRWRSESIEATKYADAVATGWYEPLKKAEEEALELWNSKAIRIPLRSLEPYYVDSDSQWTKLLDGHGVSVVSCFTKTMSSQVNNLKNIWETNIFPDTINWQWVQTGHPKSVARGSNEWPYEVTNSLEAINYIVTEVVKQGSRFALIGCGGIGMIVANKLKERGVICIVLGGAIQVLFGIKGKRWENHSVISKFWNEHWVLPSHEETPGLAKTIEGGCYWY